ncbi:MAG: hypothetical protein LBL41_01780 [Bifidobacteriaceae bacterium]|nr:hypothetical protein [Bifidobacteriaceae bacterium]
MSAREHHYQNRIKRNSESQFVLVAGETHESYVLDNEKLLSVIEAYV